MAVRTTDAGVVHAAGEKRGEFVVLVPDLTIGVIGVRFVGDGQAEVIVKGFAGNQIAGDLAAAGVAGGAGFHHLIAVELGQRGIVRAAERGLLLPLDMRLHGAVAGLAAHAHFGHRRVVAVGLRLVVFTQTGIVAGCAHRIPVHTLSGPVAPIAGSAFVAISINVEPFVAFGIQRHIAGLQPSAGRRNEELAQRVVADHSNDGIGVAFPVEPLGQDFCETVRVDEGLRGVLAVMEGLLGDEGRVVLVADFPLGKPVIGMLPPLELRGVAFAA